MALKFFRHRFNRVRWTAPHSLQRLIIVFLFLSALMLLLTAWKMTPEILLKQANYRRAEPPKLDFFCPNPNMARKNFNEEDQHRAAKKQFQTDLKILLFAESQFSAFGKQIIFVLDSLRLSYKVEITGKSIPLLTTQTRGRYALIIFENYYKYLNMDDWNRQLLDKYSRDFDVGMIGFFPSKDSQPYRKAKLRGFPLHLMDNVIVRRTMLYKNSSLLYLTRPGNSLIPNLTDFVVFYAKNPSYVPVLNADLESGKQENPLDSNYPASIVLQDLGIFDRIRRVLFGHDFSFWLCKILFVDSLIWLTDHRISLPLNRYLQIDIDDVFVGDAGMRILSDDVDAILAAQKRIRSRVADFKFNLGFSGKFFKRGDEVEQKGDEKLIGKRPD